MRLSEVLSNSITAKFDQVDGFLGNARLKIGKQKKVTVGAVWLTYFCKNCNSNITFLSGEDLYCIGVNDHLISIDCVVKCSRCGQAVPVWFLVESKNEIFSTVPEVRILKRTEKLSEKVLLGTERYGEYSMWLDKADRAYHDELGAGAIVYLRKILETATIQVAEREGINILKSNGKRRPFKEILGSVEEAVHIIPPEFSADGYRLFGELSDIVHGKYDEQLGIKKYDALRRLVVGVLDKVKDAQELTEAIAALGWRVEEEIEV